MGFPGGTNGKEREREVAQSCPTLCDPMDCSLQGSSVHGVFQARVLEWVAMQYIIWIQSPAVTEMRLFYDKNPKWLNLKGNCTILFSFQLGQLVCASTEVY